MEIGKQIKKYRSEMEVSQEELAERIFVSRQTVSNWETDKNYPDLKSLVLLSSLFGVSLDLLIGDGETRRM
jgi:transcriptional regulator with XRE-family HTH domain